MQQTLSRFITLTVLFWFCSSVLADDLDFKQTNTPENLKALCAKLQKAIAGKDATAGNALASGLMPDGARVKKAMRDDVPASDLAAIQEMHDKFKKSTDGNLSKLFTIKPEQTEIRVHGASTEELAANARDSVAWKHFPGGTIKLAQKTLKPGVKFYVVEFIKPGDTAGMKFHLFYWDGSQWAMLGPVWRVVK